MEMASSAATGASLTALIVRMSVAVLSPELLLLSTVYRSESVPEKLLFGEYVTTPLLIVAVPLAGVSIIVALEGVTFVSLDVTFICTDESSFTVAASLSADEVVVGGGGALLPPLPPPHAPRVMSVQIRIQDRIKQRASFWKAIGMGVLTIAFAAIITKRL
jgi:hypothetical protein